MVACCEDEGEDFCDGANCGEGCFRIESRVDEEEEEEDEDEGEEEEMEVEVEEEEAN